MVMMMMMATAGGLRLARSLATRSTSSVGLCSERRGHKTGTAMGCAASSYSTSDQNDHAVYYVTVNSKTLGVKIAESLLTDKLAACVNIIPGVESMYWWEGKVETDQELLLMIKSSRALLNQITKRVKEQHEYDTPEVIAVPIVGGSTQYLNWIKENTRRPR
mmetsp:Transcript_2374/g.6572  ORF Transcript_2374/g.6572 Transcript_2374/m.6572 type:complete len:162 (+) Transcript_2374:381-866(+)